jgi:1-acyl-sn-glycerol-3-phosphate acyltransferase
MMRWFNREHGEHWGTSPADFDLSAVHGTLGKVGWLFGRGRYFGLDVHGWRHVPSAPVMVVSNHSGGTTIPDAWGFGVAWYRRFTHRPLHVAAHDMILATAATRRYFGRRGILRGSRQLAHEVLTHWKRDLMVMPGGDVDTWRPYSERYRVRFGGRTGYARIALRSGVPIVPVANAGAHETFYVLSDGRRLARALHLREIARASIWPVHLSLPWGLAVGPWPHIPLPARLRYRVGEPVQLSRDPVPEPSEDMVRELDARVQAAVQSQLDLLREEAERR